MTIGKQIRDLRIANNILQRELASSLSISESYLSKIENDQKPIKRQHLSQLSEILKTNYNELESLWLAQKVVYLLTSEKNSINALKLAEEEIKYLKNKNNE